MKTCAHCKTENRDETIFCQHCRRPLGAARTPSPALLFGLLMVLVLIGLSFYLFSSRPFPAPGATHTLTTTEMMAPFPAPTRTQEPVTPGVCVRDNTLRIRRGPGTHYATIGGLAPGVCLTILGRTEEASWVYMLSDEHQTGWVDASLLGDARDLRRVLLDVHFNAECLPCGTLSL